MRTVMMSTGPPVRTRIFTSELPAREMVLSSGPSGHDDPLDANDDLVFRASGARDDHALEAFGAHDNLALKASGAHDFVVF